MLEITLGAALSALTFSLLILLGLIAAAWAFILSKRFYLIRVTPKLPSITSSEALNVPSVSIIIPARNEEASIRGSLASLTKQDYREYDIIVVDDSSTDKTLQIVREFQSRSDRIRLISSSSLPEGWVGKSWACAQGARVTKGEWLLFADADARLAPNALSLAVRYALKASLDMLSLTPFIKCEGFWSKVTTPFFVGMMTLLYPIAKVNDPREKTAYAIGSFILVRREAYGRVGGHERVKGALVEDKALGQLAKSSGLRLRLVRGEHLFTSCWNTNFKAIWQALVRVISPFVKGKAKGGLLFIFSLALGFIVPFVTLSATVAAWPISSLSPTGLIFWLSLAACFMVLASHYLDVKALRVNPLYVMAAPLAALFFMAATLTSIYKARKGKGVLWRDRTYLKFEG